jgi:riboflavin biosynthesis pyrimidine reductase
VIITTHPHLQERRAAEGRPRNPLSVVVTATCAFSDEVLATKRFFRRADLNRLIVTTSRAATDDLARVRGAGVEVEIVQVDAAGEVDLAVLLHFLREQRGAQRVLCEGGPTLLTALARRGLLDELFVTTTLRLGGDLDALRIVNLPVTDQPLHLISEMHYEEADRVREFYLRFRYPGVPANAGSGS